MKLRHKVFLLILIPLFLAVFFQVYAAHTLVKEVDHVRDSVVIISSQESLSAANLRFLSTEIPLSIDRAIIALETGDLEERDFQVRKTRLLKKERLQELKNLKDLAAMFPIKKENDPTEELLQELEKRINDVNPLSASILDELETLQDDKNLPDIALRIKTELVPIHNDILDVTTKLLENEVVEVSEARQEIEKVEQNKLKIIYISIALLVVLLLISIFIINHIAFRPMKKLTNYAVELRSGNINAKIPKSILKRKDELGDIANALKDLVKYSTKDFLSYVGKKINRTVKARESRPKVEEDFQDEELEQKPKVKSKSKRKVNQISRKLKKPKKKVSKSNVEYEEEVDPDPES